MKPSIAEFHGCGPALGMLEIDRVAAGYASADRVAKVAPVDLLLATAVTPGKFLVLFCGDVAAVASSLQAGEAGIEGMILDRLFLPQAHPSLGRAVGETQIPAIRDAVGIVEAARVSTLLCAADAAAKTGEVELLCIRLAIRLGGKAYFVVGGEVAQVTSAVMRAADLCTTRGHHVDHVVIPRPHPSLWEQL